MLSRTCIHPNNRIIIDQHEGKRICSNCALVIEDTIYTENLYCTEEKEVCPILDTIITKNNISTPIKVRSLKIKKEVRCRLPKRSSLHIAIYALYIAAIQEETPYTIEEIAFFTNLIPKKVYKIINSISKNNNENSMNTPNPLLYFDRFTAQIIDRTERCTIKKYYANNLPDKFNSRMPRLVIGGILYHYYKKRNILFLLDNLCLNTICNHLNINRRRVIAIEKEINESI